MIKRKSNDLIKMWVSEDFHRLFKVEAAKKGVSTLEYTREIAKAKKSQPDEKDNFPWIFKQ